MKQRLYVPTAAAIAVAATTFFPLTAVAQTREGGVAPAAPPISAPAPVNPPPPAVPAVAAPGSPSRATGSTSSQADYRLAAGDKLRVEVYKDAQLSQSVQIRPDGKITLPLLGDIEAQGATPIQLRDRVSEALRQYLNNPVVSVMVVEAAPPVAYVVGEVNRPGPIELKGDVTVLQALAMAGWLKDFAVSKNIRILRSGVTGAKPIPFNYKNALNGIGQPVYLQPGDTVVVPD
jgi:polysaccharide export outer membrane protein